MQIHRTRLRLGFVTALALASLAVLLAARPPISTDAWSRGDDLALISAWAAAVAASIWLSVASAGCLLAIGIRRPHLARAFSLALPAALRRSVEAAIVASCLVVAAAPAHAATGGSGPLLDQPIVRSSRSLAAAPTTLPVGAPRPVASAPPPTDAVRAPVASTTAAPRPVPSTSTAPRAANPTPPSSARRPANGAPTSRAQPATPAVHSTRVVVRPGDNLWAIARAELIRAKGAYPGDGEVARYWRTLIDANRATLRSGNPSLIFPGEIVALPPVPPVP
jgi:hypothetical protein